jgi:hypothetical protein
MAKKQVFKRHSDQKQKHYERMARLQYGPILVNESINRWNSYTKEEQDRVFEESGQIYNDIVAAIEAGKSPLSPEVQTILPRWHDNLRNFYEPTLEILRGLGELYNTEPGFIANFKKIHPDLPEYLQEAITQYVDDLEYAEIVRLLAADEEQATRDNQPPKSAASLRLSDTQS